MRLLVSLVLLLPLLAAPARAADLPHEREIHAGFVPGGALPPMAARGAEGPQASLEQRRDAPSEAPGCDDDRLHREIAAAHLAAAAHLSLPGVPLTRFYPTAPPLLA